MAELGRVIRGSVKERRLRGGGRFLTRSSASSAIISELIALNVYAAPFKGRHTCFFSDLRLRRSSPAHSVMKRSTQHKLRKTSCAIDVFNDDIKKVMFNFKKKNELDKYYSE